MDGGTDGGDNGRCFVSIANAKKINTTYSLLLFYYYRIIIIIIIIITYQYTSYVRNIGLYSF